MWFFLFGSKGYSDRLGYIVMKCPGCKTRGVFAVEQERKKFTVYFVPTFQYSKKQLLLCTTCQESFDVAKELKPEIAARLMSQDELAAKIRRGGLKKLIAGKRRKTAQAARSYCPGCESEIAADMVYCSRCGRKLK